MTMRRSWETYASTYRVKEVKILLDWITSGISGSVVGLSGSGKSNLLGFLCHRPDVVQAYLPPKSDPVVLIPLDLNNLPANNLATFYRVVLRTFYEVRDRFTPDTQAIVTPIYKENRAARDPFLPQSGLRELLLHFQTQHTRVVLVMDRFDQFCQTATPQMMNTLRGLRDSFKGTLCYLVGTRYEIAYLPNPEALGEMYEILDTHTCWVGPMDADDARRVIAEETQASPKRPTEDVIAHLLALTGGYPALLKATCHWWTDTRAKPSQAGWAEALLAERSVQVRLAEIWNGLTQEEKLALSQIENWKEADQTEEQHRRILSGLVVKGFCRQTPSGWHICGELFARHVSAAQESGGRIWLNPQTDELYQDQTPLDGLAPLERSVLRFLVTHPKKRHTKTDLIVGAWPDELRRQGVSDDSLYQVVMELRKKIEPDPVKPCYLVTWRGRPEGGYHFFPEGRPG
ncbi:MAG: winged helix-turn-helix domain-containing protein [Anaerolineae bacterium]|nr:winged helix-turn-helix domain-containing protein [Anaerolineae bacterium]